MSPEDAREFWDAEDEPPSEFKRAVRIYPIYDKQGV